MTDLHALELAHEAAASALRQASSSATLEAERRTRDSYEAALREHLASAPSDHDRRFKLGRLLFDVERIDDAINELQRAKQHPDVRTRAAAGYYLGYCFVKKRIPKLAVQELNAARAGIQLILGDQASPEARDIGYLLGRIYEAAGKKELAVSEYYSLADAGGDVSPPDGLAGALAPLRPTDPPRVPPQPGSAEAEPDRASPT